jgi:hypothetical protein
MSNAGLRLPSDNEAKEHAMNLPAMRSGQLWSFPRLFGRLLLLLAALIGLGAASGNALAQARYQAAGVAVASLDWPTHAVNDVALLFVETAGGQVPTLSVPAGFVEVTGSPQATGAGAAGTRITVFWARATSTTMASPTIVGPADHMYARIITYRGVVTAGNPWDVTGGGVKAAASTSVTVTGVTTTVANARIVQAVARDNDSAAAAFSAETNANLTGIAERNDAGTTIGGGGGLGIWDGLKATAGATGNTTANVASSINAFFTIALRPQGAAAPTYQAAGTQYMGSGSNALSPDWPAHSTNDVALLFVESAGDQPVTLSVPAGFVEVLNSPQATGTTAAGTRLTVFWARATSSAMTAPTIADPGDHVWARIITYRGVVHSGNPWDVTGGGVKAAASTSVTVTGVTTTAANTLVVQAVARHDDRATAAFSAETNANLTGIAERSDAGTTSNNGGGIGIWDGRKATAGATGNTTANVTSSINAFLTIALKSQPGPIFSNAGTAVGGAGNVSLTWPAHAIDDVALLFVESAGGEPATLSVPAGFVQVTSSPQATGTTTNGTRITVFWARATSAAMPNPTVLDPGNHVYAQIITYRGVVNTGDPWDITGGGVKTPASTSVTLSEVTTSVTDTLIVQAVARDNDSAAAAFSNQTNANLTGIGERSDAGTTSNNGGGFAIWDGYKATAGATGSTTATVTSSINAFLTIALKQQVLVTPPDHYELSLPAGSVACAANTVTVTACANSTNPCTLAMTTLAGQTATLAVATVPAAPTCALGSTSVSFNASGVATTTLNCSSVGDGATVTVTLSAEQTPATNLRKCCQGASCVTANSCAVTNKTAGFIFSDAADGAEADIAAQRAGVASATYYLRAVKTNTSTLACEAALSGNRTVDLGYECINPAACTASNLMSITAGTPSATTTIARNNSGSSASKTTVSMSFDANGNAPFTLTFNDVGRTKLHAAKAADGSLVPPLLTALAGNTPNGFVTAPYDFLVAPTGPYVAGLSFGVKATGRTSGGATTPNFGRESPAESVALKAPTAAAASATNSQLVEPPSGQFGALTAGSFTRAKCSPVSNGSVCDSALAWNEVGKLVLSAATANVYGYLGTSSDTGLVSWGSAASVVFKPAFLTTELDAAQPCTTFTYSAQPFRIKVSAMSAANVVLATAAAITQNYTGAYAKAITLGSDGAGACTPTTTGFSNNTLAAADFTTTPGSASTAPVTNTVAPLPIGYAQSLAAPSALTICAKEDADTPNSHGQTQAVLAIRNGRLRLLGAYGSELLPLYVPLRIEYYNGTTWTLSTDDACTNPLASAFALSGGIAANTSVSSVTLSGGSGTLKLATPSPAATGAVDVAANLGITGTATDASCNATSPAGTTAANLPWLQYPWCSGKLDPNARVKFGSPKAPYIYLRERY